MAEIKNTKFMRKSRLLKPFNITSVSRADLEHLGFNTTKVNESTMKELASKMADDYCEQLFWDSLPIIAEHLNIPIRKVINKNHKN